MRSLLIEFNRFNDLTTGFLRKDDPYLAMVALRPVRQFKMPLGHRDWERCLKALRYQSGAEARRAALPEIAAAVTAILEPQNISELQTGDFPLQLDLVPNAAELAALPFEAITDETGQPLLVRGDRPIELTRRVRNTFVETTKPWPASPRILFAWARPEKERFGRVPHEEHETALLRALKPWIPTDDDSRGGVLTVLEEVSLERLETACRSSFEKGEPFTHIHILAHGQAVEDVYGMALHDEKEKAKAFVASPNDVKKALSPLAGEPVIVTLAACDAAHSEYLLPEKSIAYELHDSGFPVVLASQLPLTVPGSTVIVEHFYGALLDGKDVRTALHEARLALYKESARTGHDWASLVGYVRLPEGYAEHLQKVRLDAVLASLKIARNRSIAGASQERLDDVVEFLRGRIQALQSFLDETETSAREAVLLENRGLLGSAYKRLAEALFNRGKQSGGDDWRRPVKEALESARECYQKAFESNLSHHWTGIQYLCLDAVLTGKINKPDYWQVAVAAAKIQAQKEEEIWAYGSLAELYLLAPLVGQPEMLKEAAKSLATLKERVLQRELVLQKEDRFPIETTSCQLCRYRDWWTAANGFLPGCGTDLAAGVKPLIAALS